MKNTTRINDAKWMESQKRWQIQVQREGERKTFYSSVEGTAGKRECNRKADAWLQSRITDSTMRVAQAVEKWLETKTPHGEFASSANYTSLKGVIERTLVKECGKKKMCDLTCGDVQRIIDKAFRKGLSDRTIRNTKKCIGQFLKWARKDRLTDVQIEDVDMPTNAPRKEKRTLQPDALKTLFESNRTEEYGKETEDYFVNLYRFAVLTGLRTGELLARSKSDVEGAVLNITSSYNSAGELTKGKNRNAQRRIGLSRMALEVLAAQREEEAKRHIRSTLLFPALDGGLLSQDVFRKRWYAYCAHNGIEQVTPYELRHTFVSVCKTKLPISNLKLLVGHSASMDTVGVYGHTVDGELEEIASEVENAFSAFVGK